MATKRAVSNEAEQAIEKRIKTKNDSAEEMKTIDRQSKDDGAGSSDTCWVAQTPKLDGLATELRLEIFKHVLESIPQQMADIHEHSYGQATEMELITPLLNMLSISKAFRSEMVKAAHEAEYDFISENSWSAFKHLKLFSRFARGYDWNPWFTLECEKQVYPEEEFINNDPTEAMDLFEQLCDFTQSPGKPRWRLESRCQYWWDKIRGKTPWHRREAHLLMTYGEFLYDRKYTSEGGDTCRVVVEFIWAGLDEEDPIKLYLQGHLAALNWDEFEWPVPDDRFDEFLINKRRW